MEFLQNTHSIQTVPQGAVLNLYTQSGSSARANIVTSGVPGGPYAASNGGSATAGPFGQVVDLVVEASGKIAVEVASQGSANGGSSTFAGLTDKATADLPTINGPLATKFSVVQTAIDTLVTQFQQLGSSGIAVGNDFPTTPEDTPLTGNVLTNDTTQTGTLSVTQYVVAGVAGVFTPGALASVTGKGSIVIASNGAYTFTPAANWNGTFPTVTYQVSNGAGGIAQGNLIIQVNAVNDPPVANADNVSTMQGQAITFSPLSNDTDVENDTLNITQINGTAITAGGAAVAVSSGTVALNINKSVTYTPNSTVTGPQTFSYTVSDGNGGTATGAATVTVVPTGSSLQTPFVAYVDTLTVPGGAVGENSLGGYLGVYGTNFGQVSDLGSLTKVYVGGIEVANYRALVQSRCFPKTGIMCILVQVGNLIGAGLLAGTAYPVTVVRGGTATSNNDKTVIPTTGNVIFFGLDGDDNTGLVNRIDKKFRHVQTTDTSNHTNGGAINVAHAGDQIVGTAGNYTDTTGIDGCLCRFSGTGYTLKGTATAWIHFTSYPGSIGANAPHDVHHTGQAGFKAGIQGPNSSYWDATGHYICVSRLHLDADANAQSDAAPINMQYAHYAWRAVDNELGPWNSAIVALAGGISGHAQNSAFIGNHIHHMGCTGALTNHGIYADSGALNWEIAYNWIHDITGGNFIQLFDQLGLAGGTIANMPTGWLGFEGFKVHHNWLENCGKYGLNWQVGVIGVDTYNNFVIGATYAGVRMDLSYPQKNWALNFEFNTFYNNDQVASGSGNNQMLNDNWNTPVGGTIRFAYNIFAAGPLTLAASGLPNPGGVVATYWSWDYNNFAPYQSAQSWSSFSYDAHVTFNDPKFTSPSTGDFSLQATSPRIDAAGGTPYLTVNTDFFSNPRPQGAARDIGAFELVNNNPYLTAAPTFAGTQRVGSASSVSTGTWGNNPTSYSYQWFTAATSNGTPNNIAGATSASYTWVLGDQGKYGGCTVTATNANGSTSTNVYIGGAVAAHPNAPVNTVQPSITGTGGIGNLLTRVAGTWTPASGVDVPTITWYWRRNGTKITGTDNAATYTQVSADDSATIDLLETGTNQWGFNTASSSNTISVPHVPAAPVVVGTATAFDSTPTTVTVTLSVQAGDWVLLAFSAAGNNVYNLTITDTMGGANTDWGDLSFDGGSGSIGGGPRCRKMPSTGSVTITIGKDGGATYAGEAVIIRGVAATRDDGTPVLHAGGTTSPATVTPTTTTNAKDLLVNVVSVLNSGWCTVGTKSDTLVASNDQAGIGRQVVVQTRTTSSAGAQSAMTMALAGGGSGTDIHSVSVVINFKGA